jgi:hypothetical protein
VIVHNLAGDLLALGDEELHLRLDLHFHVGAGSNLAVPVLATRGESLLDTWREEIS